VFRDGVRRAMPVLHRVTVLAAIPVRLGRKLIVVRVLVTIRTRGKPHFINCVLASRNVALCAFHLPMLALQRILRCIVLLHAEERRFPPIDCMALGALAFFRPGFELPLVWIGRVAVFARSKRDFLLEVVFDVASRTSNLGVFAKKGIFGFGVIKIKARQHGLPAACCVAGFARLLEFAAVRIHVACRAGVKLYVFIARGAAGRVRLMAFFASHLDVQPG